MKSPAALDKLFTTLSSESDQALPESMRRAVRFMFAGAAATAVWGIFLAVVTGVNAGQLATPTGNKASGGQVLGYVIYDVLITIILVAIWVLMARMTQQGRGWARIASSVLFLLWSLNTYQYLGALAGQVLVIVNVVLVLLVWIAGLGALFCLWRPDSTDHFRAAR